MHQFQVFFLAGPESTAASQGVGLLPTSLPQQAHLSAQCTGLQLRSVTHSLNDSDYLPNTLFCLASFPVCPPSNLWENVKIIVFLDFTGRNFIYPENVGFV